MPVAVFSEEGVSHFPADMDHYRRNEKECSSRMIAVKKISVLVKLTPKLLELIPKIGKTTRRRIRKP